MAATDEDGPPLAADRDAVRAELELRVAWGSERSHTYDVAVWQLLLGRPEDGLATLRTYLAATSATPAAWGEQRPELALIAGDWERAAAVARLQLGEPTERLVPGYRSYVRALYGLIAGDTSLAAVHVEELRAFVEHRDRLRSGHPAAVAGVVEGLLERSAERVASGLDALLAWHLRRARSRSEIFNSARAVVSLEAVAVLLLAHRLGLSVDVSPAYRRASLPLLAIHLQQWKGEPLPRAARLSIETDLVAGPWLRESGVPIADPPPSAGGRKASGAPRPRRLRAELGEADVRESLRERVRARQGSAWQIASWALMLDDPETARTALRQAALAAERSWQESVPPGGTILRAVRRDRVLPNHNFVREHFALALVLGDDDALRRTSDLLAEWDETARLEPRYSHAAGYLDLVRHLLDGRSRAPTDGEARQAFGPLPSLRVACAGLLERDRSLLERGLGGVLREHAGALERRTSPDPPVCAPAIHVAAAAGRLGIPLEIEPATRDYDVPIVVPERGRKIGRLSCDLLGTALWRRA